MAYLQYRDALRVLFSMCLALQGNSKLDSFPLNVLTERSWHSHSKIVQTVHFREETQWISVLELFTYSVQQFNVFWNSCPLTYNTSNCKTLSLRNRSYSFRFKRRDKRTSLGLNTFKWSSSTEVQIFHFLTDNSCN